MRVKNLQEIILLKKKPLLALAVLLLIVAGLYFYISAIQESALETIRQAWMSKRRLQMEAGPASIGTVYSQGVRDLAVFYGRVPAKREFARQLGDIFEIVSNNGLTLKTVGYKPGTTKSGGLMSYQLDLNLTGRYAPVKSFIADIQRLREAVTMDSMQLTGAGPDQESIDIKVQLTTYFRTDGQ